ncbi:Hypothetical predicted protein [Paramuricea clavata]|uniref:Uncharacterized protein n=1 Tax=Paramuricea clavata TaxID=317549 RepID=A0A6S7JSD8_PARCT|nr:Hypothetical predicted protein [Paramuricea clavata]
MMVTMTGTAWVITSARLKSVGIFSLLMPHERHEKQLHQVEHFHEAEKDQEPPNDEGNNANTSNDNIYNYHNASGYDGEKNKDESVKSIAADLLQGKVFDHISGRYHPGFERCKSNILDIEYRDFFTWAKNHLKHWKEIYETANKQ